MKPDSYVGRYRLVGRTWHNPRTGAVVHLGDRGRSVSFQCYETDEKGVYEVYRAMPDAQTGGDAVGLN